jgi:hypothetical protein
MESPPLSPLVRFASYVVHYDPEILARSPPLDRQVVVAEALTLLLVAGITGTVWTAFWALFFPWPVACGIGLAMFAFFLLLDRALGAADWRLSGILRKVGGGYGRQFWVMQAARLGVVVIMSLATATGLAAYMADDATADQLARDRRKENYAIEERYAQADRDLRQRWLGSLNADVQKQAAVVEQIITQLDPARKAHAAAEDRLKTAQIEADRELKGAPGYQRGGGPKYRAALAAQQAAQADLVKADADVAIYEPRLKKEQDKLDELRGALKKAEEGIQGKLDQLEKEKQAQLVPARRDALLSYIALQEVFDSPNYGAAARWFEGIMRAILMTIELSYLAVRLWFAHASIYMARLIAETKLAAMEINAELERRAEALRVRPDNVPRTPAPRLLAPLRFVRWHPLPNTDTGEGPAG